MHHCNTDKDNIDKESIQKYNIYSQKFKSNSDIVRYIYNNYSFTYNNDGKEPGRSKSCIRFYGDANSRTNQGKHENGNETKHLLKNNKNESNAMRYANIINTNGLGSNLQFGNDYTNRTVLVTYLGTTEGQPGGSGAPPRNKF
uniref:Uncharacterized protein n=1 Tax=viral metagenome TaxID=1070528 RepID=A0A6C0EDJ8_9ZZZZ